MTKITFPLNTDNVSQCMAERDAEIMRLRDINKKLVDDLKDMIEIVEDIPHYANRAKELLAEVEGKT